MYIVKTKARATNGIQKSGIIFFKDLGTDSGIYKIISVLLQYYEFCEFCVFCVSFLLVVVLLS